MIFAVVLSSFLLFSCASKTVKVPTVSKNIESPTFGDINAKAQVMIFSDFECPACINFEKIIWEKLLNEYALTNKIGLTYKNFPLTFHPNAFGDALAAMCAHAGWKYSEFAKAMYALEDTKKWEKVTPQEREKLATDISLNMADFNKCVIEWHYINKINEDLALWNKMQLVGTPSVYVNWKILNFTSEQDFFTILDQLIK
ncbi:MAG: hypothetical protein ACD_49C00082G0006 [uncultured bacterium (gcode 4)]|uniref:Thioredoxin-like fold domain-containing protein n=1 Tax=uncultured bacterium (gcode 4) TaxID=1234023 RepID=K2AVD3_9BACT|nr:MAG: hypothetical protein ACD_49C00082G0006 [uncultured bacterium (gcode 4)]